MRVSDFCFDLPAELIAETATEPRDAARMLVHDRSADATWHRQVADLGDYLRPGDLLVLNDTRVMPHRLLGRRSTGGRVEVMIVEREGAVGRALVKPARKIRLGEPVPLEGGRLDFVATADLGKGAFEFRLDLPADGDVDEVIESCGRAPLPPYIRRDAEADPALDRERYQTVFARDPGAVAAPTAGLHFTRELLANLAEQGVEQAFVTLHVGEGTFAPIRVDSVEDHVMHSERFVIGDDTVAAVARTRERGGRVIAVGTTAARVLETQAQADRTVKPGRGSTQLFLYPGRPLQVVDALLTNFHLPESTLLMLVSAFAGRERMLRLYREAIAERYRFYSFGDAMLLL